MSCHKIRHGGQCSRGKGTSLGEMSCFSREYDVREVLKVLGKQCEARLRCGETTKTTSLALGKGTMVVVKVKRGKFAKKLITLGCKTRAVARVERDKFGIIGGKLESTCSFGHHTHAVTFILIYLKY